MPQFKSYFSMYEIVHTRLTITALSFIAFFGFSLSVSAQSPTCDIPAIMAAFTGAGYVPLNVQGQPCSLYFVNPSSQEAAQAQAAAATLGANLVFMNDAAENTNVSAALDASPYNGATIWIGVQRTGAGANMFFASDGTTGPFPPGNGNPNIYQNWAGGEPNNNGYGDTDWLGNCDYECTNGEQCVQIYPGGQWNDLQCNESSISVIEVNLCPEISVVASANNVCAGNPVTLTASTLLGSTPYQYAWSTNEFTPAITVTPAQTTTYDVAVADRYQCSAQESVTVTILAGPSATFDVGGAVCIGEPATISYTGSGGVGATYTWNFGSGVVVSGSGQGPYQVSWAASGQQAITLTVTENGCSSPLESQNVTISPSPTADFTFTVVCEGTATDLTNTSVGNGGVLAGSAWDFGGGNTQVSTDASYTFPSSGTFPVTLGVATVDGCVAQVTQQVTVNPGPTALFNSTDITCFGACDGTINAVVQGGAPPVNLAWSDGSVGTNLINLCPGSITGTVTDANGCEIVEQIDITEPLEITIAFAVTDNICFGGNNGGATVTVSNGVQPYSIVWTDAFGTPLQANIPSTGVESLSGLGAGTYILGVQDATGCQTAASFTITQPAVNLVMNLTPQDLSCFESGDGEIAVSQNGLSPYTFALSDVFGNPLESVNAAGNNTFQDLDIGIYFVEVTDANGCITTDAVELFQPEPLAIESTVVPISCFGGSDGSVQVTLISGGTTPYAPVVWDDPNSQTGSAATSLSVGTYMAAITDANGCVITESFILGQPPKMNLIPGYVTDTCGQVIGAATVQVTFGTPPYFYFWKPDGITTATHFNLAAGLYEVVVSDANGCQDSVFTEVKDDLPYPYAAFDYVISGDHFLEQEVQFINNSVGTSQWKWNFGDGESSFEEDPKHRYDDPGDYLVQLLGSNGYCYDTAYQYVNIDPLLTIYIPNAFTPGESSSTQDGKNDYFFPQGEGFEEESYDMFIFDRWGKMVWQTGKFGQKWDGRHMDSLELVPNGTYVYQITFREFADNDRHIYNGVVHVIRQ